MSVLPETKARMARRTGAEHLGWVLGLFFIGLTAKFQLIQKYGSPLPYLDQWPSEAIDLFIPWFTKQFSLATLFQAHNEHRIVFTQLCELGLLLANGQWDARLEMVVNACIHAAAIAGFGWLMVSLLGKRAWPLVWTLLALDLVLPFAWENTLWGFQSQFYFLQIFSLLTLWLLGLGEPFSRRWWWGVVCAVLSLFTMASGFLAADAVVILVFLDVLKQRENWRHHLPTLAVCAAVTVAGILLKKDVPEHHQFQAHSAVEFVTALGKNLAWPWATKPFYAPLNLLPLAVLAWMHFRFSRENLAAERMVLGIGFWVVLQSLAAAYARGFGGTAPMWRYMDLLSFLMIANALSIWLLLNRYCGRLKFAPAWRIGFAFWALGCAGGLYHLSERAWDVYIPDAAHDQAMQLQNARAFLTSDDARVLSNCPPAQLIVGNVDAVVWLLRHPVVRHILPACARAPLEMTENVETSFLRNGCPVDMPEWEICWGSYSKQPTRSSKNFESLPIHKTALPYLEIPVAGDLGKPGFSLGIVDLATGKTNELQPPQPAGDRWVNLRVRAPAGQFKMIAQDEGGTGWFAFKAPREMGWLSCWARQTVAAWKYFLSAGILCLAATLMSKFHGPLAPVHDPSREIKSGHPDHRPA